MANVFETERMYLREMQFEDIAALRPILGDQEVMRFSLRGSLNDEQVTEFIDNAQARQRNDGSAVWSAFLKATDELIGVIGLPVQEVEGEKHLEVAYRLHPLFWGKGLATEAAAGCRDYAFSRLKKQYLVSLIEEANVRSIAVAERIGMTFEREAVVWNKPLRIYSITNEQ